jgi:Protein of unknown function (DUF1573)
MKPTHTIIAFAVALSSSFTARAELKWEQTTIELHPAVTDKQAVAHFKYQNAGDQVVRFTSVKSSCGCTVAQPQKNDVAPGEKGEITATFNIGDRVGTQVKSVTVQTDDPAHAVTVLNLKAIIPQVLEITPNFVFWQSGEEPKPKTINVKAGKDFSVKGIKVNSSSPDFQAKVEPAGNDQFKIDVQPRDTGRASASALTIQPENSTKTFMATARVMPAPLKPVPSPSAAPSPSPASH